MKNKIYSFIMAICLIIPSVFVLTACNLHVCDASAEWSTDETHHWHACKDQTCSNILDKTEHYWDNGVVTTAATYKKNGVKTYTCVICDATKTEPVLYSNTITSEWHTALGLVGVTNVVCVYQADGFIGTYKYDDGIICISDVYENGDTQETFYTKEDGDYYIYDNINNEVIEKDYYDEIGYNECIPESWFIDNTLFRAQDFTFNPETEKYETNSTEWLGQQYTNVQIGFEDGKVVSISATREGYSFTYTFTYGNAELSIPTEFEWATPK